nr:RWD domain-containing protein 3 isoform X8 [Caretta caretta]
MVVHRKLCASLEPRVLLFLPLDPWTLGGEDEQRHSTSKTWRMVSSLVMLQWSLGLRVRYLGAVQDDLREALSCGIPYQQRQGTKVSTLAQPRTLNSLPGTIARNPEPLLMNSPSGTPLPRTGSGMMITQLSLLTIKASVKVTYCL